MEHERGSDEALSASLAPLEVRLTAIEERLALLQGTPPGDRDGPNEGEP